ncbi:MAG: sigma-70 region 4 domain-containing protein [Bacteriovoracaceae bacterium]|jgi:DNA-directed RNA polymerase specialized sigma24 family protein|nr:sigma-70 region 4 domain-containing protein [Bacteriovoracaceae bacterium]
MIFNDEDKRMLLLALARIETRRRKSIVLRFWHNYSIAEIAKELKVSWDRADHLVEDTILMLRRILISEMDFKEYNKREQLLNKLRKTDKEKQLFKAA